MENPSIKGLRFHYFGKFAGARSTKSIRIFVAISPKGGTCHVAKLPFQLGFFPGKNQHCNFQAVFAASQKLAIIRCKNH